MKYLALICLFIGYAQASLVLPALPRAIYNTDDRRDFHQIESVLHKELADSTVAIINSKRELRKNPEAQSITYKYRVYGESENLCHKKEKFYAQIAISHCSGALVGEDIVLTAAHCLEGYMPERLNFVFGYNIKSAGSNGSSTFSRSEIYELKEVLVDRPVIENNIALDLALVRLDRKVTNHSPLSINLLPLENSAHLFGLGHPNGLPLKMTDGHILENEIASPYIKVDLDFFGGNSGSSVFNFDTGLIEGVLIKGQTDFKESGSCKELVKCSGLSDCSGETVIKSGAFLPFIEKFLN